MFPSLLCPACSCPSVVSGRWLWSCLPFLLQRARCVPAAGRRGDVGRDLEGGPPTATFAVEFLWRTCCVPAAGRRKDVERVVLSVVVRVLGRVHDGGAFAAFADVFDRRSRRRAFRSHASMGGLEGGPSAVASTAGFLGRVATVLVVA